VKGHDEEEQEAVMGSSFSEENEQRRALMEAIFREHFTEVHRYISNKVRQPSFFGKQEKILVKNEKIHVKNLRIHA
jgi:hypothetical protein